MIYLYYFIVFLVSVELVESTRPLLQDSQFTKDDDTHSVLNEVLNRLHMFENKLAKSDNEIFKLRETTAIQNDVINQQAQQIKKLENEVERLNDVVALNTAKSFTNSKHIKLLRKQFKQQLLNRFTKNGEQQADIASESTKTSQISKTRSVKPERPNRQVSSGVAFTAYLDHDIDFGYHQTLIFNQIVTNEGNGYNSYTGVFTCPKDGVYFFSFSIGQRSDTEGIHQLWGELMVNNQVIIDAAAETKYRTQDDQGSNTVVKRLKQGDSVWVRGHSSGDHVEGSGLRITSFTGMYLYH